MSGVTPGRQKADTSLGEILRFCIRISFLSVHPFDTVYGGIHGVGHINESVLSWVSSWGGLQWKWGLDWQYPLVHPLVLGPVLTLFHLRNSSCCKHGGVQRTFIYIGVSVDKVFIC